MILKIVIDNKFNLFVNSVVVRNDELSYHKDENSRNIGWIIFSFPTSLFFFSTN